MLQRLGEAEVALLVAFTQVKTVRVVALHVGGKFGHFGPGLAGFFFAHASNLLPTFRPRACGITTSS